MYTLHQELFNHIAAFQKALISSSIDKDTIIQVSRDLNDIHTKILSDLLKAKK